MSKINVLHMPIYDMCGINQYIFNIWEFIDRSKFHFDFATLSKKKLDFEQKLNEEGCKIHYISCYAEDNPVRFVKELNDIINEGYNAVHLHTSFWRGLLMEEVAVQLSVPVIIVHSHNTMVDIADDSKRERFQREHERIKLQFNTKLATHFCACSSLAADWLFGKQIPRERIQILNNAIDTDKFSYNTVIRDKYRKELGLEDCFLIGHTGRIAYQKNHDFLVDIFHKVCKQIQNTKLLLIGDGELRGQIENKVDKLGLKDKVLFLGERNDVAGLLQALDVFVLPSRFEGLGLVLVEAQTAGLKCLASQFVPAEAKLTSNLEYLAIDVDIWANRIIKIAKTGYERKDMSAEVEKAGYSLKKEVKVLERIYSGEFS